MDILDLMEEGKIKRFFQVRNKISFDGAICHVTQRAPGKEPLFVEESDYLRMLSLMKESVKKFDYELFSFVLMTNHLHLLIRLHSENMSLAMKHLFESYAKYFNKKYERKGPVFCKPYRAALCLDDIYLLAASIYIHLNPVKAGMVKVPGDYRWSSSKLYFEDKKRKTFVNYEFVLKTLDDDIGKAKEIYWDLVSIMREEMWTKDVLEDPKGLEKYKNKFFKCLTKVIGEERIQNIISKDILDSKVIDESIEKLRIKRRLKTPQEVQARKYLIEQLMSRGYKVTEIAKKLDVSRKVIYNTLNTP